MPFLYYWRPDNHRRDRRFGFGYHLNQGSPVLAEAAPGDSVWTFTRRGRGPYVLAAELVVKAVTTNRAGYRYGRYRVWADLGRSRYFDVDAAADAERLLRSLSVRARAAQLGQSFQGRSAVRRISAADHALLAAFAADQPEEQRVAIYPEDEFEARLLLGDAARGHVVREEAWADSPRYRYLHESVQPQRARRLVERLHELYAGRCQVCGYDPLDAYGHRLCHGHHIEWLSRGGEDALENLVLVCPNHHAAIHRDDAAFDFEAAEFRFSGGRREALQLDRHLRSA